MTVETARRHGQADPRFAARPRLRLIRGGDAPWIAGLEKVVHGPRGLTLTEAQDAGVSVWENEGGRSATGDVEVAEAPPALDWYAFCQSFFPGRRRHDLEAVKAYAAYRATGLVRPVVAAIP
ncbi:MAG TPA: hypothetical protein VFU10_01880 [Gaiellaceae bacterium]|nr:hypothetical protein [Gaiellaceae bacterium]